MSTTSEDTLRIHAMPGTGRLPTVSPFSLKMETWLRMAGVPYEHVDDMFHASPNGHLPFLSHRGERIPDSTRIIAYVKAERGVDPDARLDARERALATLLRHAFEDALYFVRVYDSFAIDANFEHIKGYMRAFVPPEQHEAVCAGLRMHQLEKLQRQGTALLSTSEVHHKGMAVIDATAELLGDQPFFFGDTPTTSDAIVYGFLATQLDWFKDSAISARVRSHPNLVAFIARVDARYWS